jgi:hypothetical protein
MDVDDQDGEHFLAAGFGEDHLLEVIVVVAASTLLDYDIFAALRGPPSPTTGPIWLATDLTQDEIQQSNAGVVLWSISIAANDWQPPELLSRLCI